MCSGQRRARKVGPQRDGRRRTGCFVLPRYLRRLLPATRETPCLSLASFLVHPCEGINEPEVFDALSIKFQQFRISDYERERARTADGDIDTILRIEEFDLTR